MWAVLSPSPLIHVPIRPAVHAPAVPGASLPGAPVLGAVHPVAGPQALLQILLPLSCTHGARLRTMPAQSLPRSAGKLLRAKAGLRMLFPSCPEGGEIWWKVFKACICAAISLGTCVLEEVFLEEGALAVALHAAPLAAILEGAVAAQERPRAALARHPAPLVVGAVREGVPALPCTSNLALSVHSHSAEAASPG